VNLRLKPDCIARGASRTHLTNSCFRIPMTGAIVADKRGGAFADDLYLVMEDNRNGTRDNTNSDVFFFKSIDGGANWIGPTRVNDDASSSPPTATVVAVASRRVRRRPLQTRLATTSSGRGSTSATTSCGRGAGSVA
jgi:hypothetical protein